MPNSYIFNSKGTVFGKIGIPNALKVEYGNGANVIKMILKILYLLVLLQNPNFILIYIMQNNSFGENLN